MATFSASAWQVQAAWLIAKSQPLQTTISMSQAFRMLREQGHEPLMKAIKGPVLQAAWERGGVNEMAPLLFRMNTSLKATYDTGAYGEITLQHAVSLHNMDGPMVISGKMWAETMSRITKLERLLKK